MSEKEATSFVSALNSIINVDLNQAISQVKNRLLNEKKPLSFELFKLHSQSLKVLKELIALEAANENEKVKREVQPTVESLISDVCLPFLRSFAPSYDGRVELSAAVLNICDLIHACVKRSSPQMSTKVLEQCLQSLLVFHNEGARHMENSADPQLDILCAVELLCTILETCAVPEDNQNENLYDRIFSLSLSALPHLDNKEANRLISFVTITLIQLDAKKKVSRLSEVWHSIETDVSKSNGKMPSRTLQLHLAKLCSMANFFFPLSNEAGELDVRQHATFWELVQCGLYNENPATRKRSMYLLKRIIDTCEKSQSDFMPQNVSSDSESDNNVLPHFWWSKQIQLELSNTWQDFLLLLETLDEKQTHVIKPILPRMQSLITSSQKKNGSVLLHTSWLVTILLRAFRHESVYIIRWAAETVLLMDFVSVPFTQQGQLLILTEQLLGFLQDLKLYQRPDGSPVGSCSAVGTGLKQFFANVCRSLDSKSQKVVFFQQVLQTLREDNWCSVPLIFITEGLSCVQPEAVFDQSILRSIREIVIANLTTMENLARGAVECFLTKTVLNLVDKSSVSVDNLMKTLAMMRGEESLQRGTSLWSAVVSWLLDASRDDHCPAWDWTILRGTLLSLVDSNLTVSEDGMGTALAETLRATKLARFAVLMSDCDYQMKGATKDESARPAGKGVLTDALAKSVDVINSINNRVYMSTLKADRAMYLLVSCVKELGKEKDSADDMCRRELHGLIYGCWTELLLYVEKRALHGETESGTVDLDLVVFYTDAIKTLGELLQYGLGIKDMDKLASSCIKIMGSPTFVHPLQQVAAVSFLSSLAQVLRAKAETSGDGDDHLMELFRKLCKVFCTTSIHCDIFSSHKGGSSADRGRQVCQYMMSLWQCLRVLLSSQAELGLHHDLPILEAALEAFSISSGESDLPILQCAGLAMPQAVKECDSHDRVIQLVEVAWGKVREDVMSWSFWLKMEAFVNMVLQRPLLELASQQDSGLGTFVTQVMQRFFEVGEEKSGLLNLVIGQLVQLWSGPDGISLALKMVPTLVDTCMFGTLHKKGERLWIDVCMYIETLKEDCSVNEILSSSSKNDIYVRLTAFNFLSTLRPGVTSHETLATAVLREAWSRYLDLARLPIFRQFTNTQSHRQKQRVSHIFPLLDSFIDEKSCHDHWRNAWEALVLECHPSVRQNLEWLVMRLVHRFPTHLLPCVWTHFDEFSDKRNVSLVSLLHMVGCIGPELPQDLHESFYLRVVPVVVPWLMTNHFNTRLHAQATMLKLWTQCQQLHIPHSQFQLVECCIKFITDNGTLSPVLGKLLDNYFYSHFDFLRDYSMETLFYTLPRLSCMSDDEWLHPDLFGQLDSRWQTDSRSRPLTLNNKSELLAACEPGPWKMKATVETNEDGGDSGNGDVQKKVIPWRLMMPESSAEQEYTCRRKGRKTDGLVLVTSLINKVPNLGGLCRTSEIFGVSEFVINNLTYLNDRVFQSLSVTAEKWLPITEVPFFRLGNFLEEKRRESYTLVGVEQTANSVDLTEYKFPKRTLLVLGNEKEGIPPDVLQQLDVCVEIPQQGIIRSLNVHVSGALLVWEYTRQQMENTNTEAHVLHDK